MRKPPATAPQAEGRGHGATRAEWAGARAKWDARQTEEATGRTRTAPQQEDVLSPLLGDADALIALTDPDVTLDFGGGSGVEELRKRLDGGAYNSWRNLADAVRLGCGIGEALDHRLHITGLRDRDFGLGMRLVHFHGDGINRL